MPAPPHVFSLADVRDLSRAPNANLSRDDGGGSSYPQRGWVNEAVRAYYEHHRSASALDAARRGRTWSWQRVDSVEARGG
jgi:hypothetical protein